MRFGHRPKVADPFCGSGQIPFEAARLGCDIYASDLNPIACMLTWGAFHIVGASPNEREKLKRDQLTLTEKVQNEIDRLGIETDGNGWRAKVFLYCVEVRCPQTGWLVPLLPSRRRQQGVSRRRGTRTRPRPASATTSRIRSGVSDVRPSRSGKRRNRGTRDGRYGEAFLIHEVNGKRYKTNITTLRGDVPATRWHHRRINDFGCGRKDDFMPQSRLTCCRSGCTASSGCARSPARNGSSSTKFRAVTEADLEREQTRRTLRCRTLGLKWQAKGWVPDMRIEVGGPPRYQGRDLRPLTRLDPLATSLQPPTTCSLGGLINRHSDARLKFATLPQVLNKQLPHQPLAQQRWRRRERGSGSLCTIKHLNTFFNYGCRGSHYALDLTRGRVQTASEVPTANDANWPASAAHVNPHRFRHLHHGSPLRRRRQVRGDPRLLHRMAAQEPTAGVCRLGLG